MINSLIITTPQAMSAPPAGTPTLRVPGDEVVITSDTFSGASTTTLAGRSTDSALGGASLPWQFSNAAAFGIASGALSPGSSTGTGVAVLDISPRLADMTVSVKVTALDPAAGTNQSSFLVARRSSLASPTSQIRLGFSTTTASLYTQINGGSQTYVTGSATPVVPGDVVGVRESGGLVQMLLNGAVVAEARYPESSFSGNLVGITSSANAKFGFDDFKVAEIIR